MFGLNFGTGFGRMGAGRRAFGGTPTPPSNALILNGQILTLNGQTLILGA